MTQESSEDLQSFFNQILYYTSTLDINSLSYANFRSYLNNVIETGILRGYIERARDVKTIMVSLILKPTIIVENKKIAGPFIGKIVHYCTNTSVDLNLECGNYKIYVPGKTRGQPISMYKGKQLISYTAKTSYDVGIEFVALVTTSKRNSRVASKLEELVMKTKELSKEQIDKIFNKAKKHLSSEQIHDLFHKATDYVSKEHLGYLVRSVKEYIHSEPEIVTRWQRTIKIIQKGKAKSLYENARRLQEKISRNKHKKSLRMRIITLIDKINEYITHNKNSF